MSIAFLVSTQGLLQYSKLGGENILLEKSFANMMGFE
jgi:hypothetical protein